MDAVKNDFNGCCFYWKIVRLHLPRNYSKKIYKLQENMCERKEILDPDSFISLPCYVWIIKMILQQSA